MKIIEDDEKYAAISREFLSKVVTGIVQNMHDQKLVNFDVFKVDEESKDLIWTTAFRYLLYLEDHGGFDVSGEDFVAHCMFSISPRNPEDIFTSNKRTDLHGGITDEIIDEAIRNTQEEVEYQRMIASGELRGVGIYAGKLRGSFLFEKVNGSISFKTSDNFFFSGTPSPGFALGSGNIENVPPPELDKLANETKFLELPGSGSADGPQIELTGEYSVTIPENIELDQFDTVFLWCFQFPVLLGVGKIAFV